MSDPQFIQSLESRCLFSGGAGGHVADLRLMTALQPLNSITADADPVRPFTEAQATESEMGQGLTPLGISGPDAVGPRISLISIRPQV